MITITRTNLDGSRIAVFSPCDTYRYELLIRWSDKPVMAFIGLNPSTADEMQNDPTISRLCTRAEALRYGALLMLNAFAMRATNPKDMLRTSDPTGGQTPQDLVSAATNYKAEIVIAGWGNDGAHLGRSGEIIAAFEQAGIPLHCLTVNAKTGEPGHPLYLPYTLRPVRFGRVA